MQPKNLPDINQALRRLIRVKGHTGDESRIIQETAELAGELDLSPEVSDMGIIISVKGQPKRSSSSKSSTLLLNTHLDTVKEGSGWSVDPYAGVIKDDYIFGRGAVDARGCAVAMLYALNKIKFSGLLRGKVTLALSIGEEGNHPSLPDMLKNLGQIDCGIIGEPTAMQIATSQRGLMVAKLIASGNQEHAARAKGINAIDALISDLDIIKKLEFLKDAELGTVSITPTRLSAGIADNTTPPDATAMLDIRSTPSCDNKQIRIIIEQNIKNKLNIISDQWVPCSIDKNHKLVKAALKSLPDSTIFASDAASDWAALQAENIPAIKTGPGDNTFSHKADERIGFKELEAGMCGYYDIIRNYMNDSC